VKSEAELVPRLPISQFFEISRRRYSCNSVINRTKIRSSCSGRPSVSDPVFSDVGTPLVVEIDQVGSSYTVLSVVAAVAFFFFFWSLYAFPPKGALGNEATAVALKTFVQVFIRPVGYCCMMHIYI